MSRKDTIIIAVFVNAALLVVLLTTALKKEDGLDPVVIQETNATPPIAQEIAPVAAPVLDEVDQAITQFAQAPAPTPPSDFVQDLQAIATPAPVLAVEPSVTPVVAVDQIEVKVKKGDVLEKIAKHHGTSVEEIMKINGLSSTRLRIGQVLKVTPNKSSALSSRESPAPVKYYTVKNGDNPWTIAVKNHMKVDELLKLNNLNEEKARKLKPGDKLKIK